MFELGFEREKYAGKYQLYSKKLYKFLGILSEINEQISDELVLRHMRNLKEA